MLYAVKNPHPISNTRMAFHLPNIGNSIAHPFTISDLLGLIYTKTGTR
jgi:hypothetical protein